MNQNRSKKQLRSEYIKKRNKLTEEEVERKSKKITEFLLREKTLVNARKVGLYFPADNEVNTEFIFNYLRSQGIITYYPRVCNSGLEFREVRDLSELVCGSYGISEPGKIGNAINNTELDLIVVPGIVFDISGNRIGYGKGFYDHYLSGMEGQRIYGISYQFQIVPEIPAETHDKRMGKIVTEQGLIECEKERRK